ncbi:MAG TPA: type II secretion system inner membrane protein GspF [Casimicrobiaceae bacterium]|nr:type II secretion system inner membrane protein GspF [Casimicrobiaceae bacterium]
MAAYRWEAVDAQGRVKRGHVDAASARAARDRLRADGLTPTAIDAARDRGDPLGHVRLAPEQVALLTRQLATLAQSGMPLDQALSAVAEQADDARAAGIVTALRNHIATGESLPAAMARFPRTFSPLYRGLVAAGSDSGRLPDVLARLADYLEARAALRQKFTTALIYPMLVTIIALGVIAVLLTYVVPQVVAVYQQSRQTLPWLTRALIATSEFFRATGWVWLGAAIAALVAFIVADRRPAFRARWHAWALRWPGVGKLLRSLDTARFASTLAILVGSGAPLLRSLEAAASVVRMIPLAEAARAASLLVREGVSLSRALKEQKVFPPVLIHLVANGEQSGTLAPMLERAAGELEREAERRLVWVTALIQPVLIVLMGAIVLVLVLAVMLPIVSMNQLVR